MARPTGWVASGSCAAAERGRAEYPRHVAPVGTLQVAVGRDPDRRGDADGGQRCRDRDREHPAPTAPAGQAARDEQAGRQPQGDDVASDELVEPDHGQDHAEREAGQRQPAGHERTAALLRAPGHRQARQRDRHQADGDVAQHRSRGRPGADQELRHDLAQAQTERGGGDPAVVAGAVLGDGEWDQSQTPRGDDGDGDPDRRIPAMHCEQPHRFGHDGHRGEVVRGQGERRRDHPQGHDAWRRALQSMGEGQQRQRREQDEQ